MTNRGDLTHEQWERLAPLLPLHLPRMGRTAADHRRMLDSVLWKVRAVGRRTGALWPLVHAGKPAAALVPRGRLGSGVPAVQEQADVEGRLDWEVQFVDGSAIRPHQHAAGGKGGSGSNRSSAAGGASQGPPPGGRWVSRWHSRCVRLLVEQVRPKH